MRTDGGQRIGRYTVRRLLARGGMAEIFLAETTDIPGVKRVVVIKRMLPEFSQDEGYARMFLDEARIVASLSHPNIVQIVEVGRQDGDLFLAMEHIDGPSLYAVMEQAASRGVRIPLEVALHVIAGVLTGLHYVHEMRDEAGRSLRLIHRDISPRNVLITWEGAVKIVDFGIARAENRLGTTRDGRVRGTVPYMSPEQCRGRQLDRRTDLYSAAILLYEMTVGRRLYDGESEFVVFEQIVIGAVRRPSEIVPDYPPELERVVLRGLALQPADRFGTAAEMLDALDAVGRGLGLVPSARTLQGFLRAHLPPPSRSGVTPQAPGPTTKPTRTAEAEGSAPVPAAPAERAKRRRPIAAVGAALAVALIVAAGASSLRRHRPEPVVTQRPQSTAPATPPPAPERAAPVDRQPHVVDRPAPATERPRPAEPPPAEAARASPTEPRGAHPSTGELVIEAVPWCLVSIDGKERGPTPLIAKLPAGPHQVRLSNTQYAIDRTTRIVIPPGRSVRRRFDFPHAAVGTESARAAPP